MIIFARTSNLKIMTALLSRILQLVRWNKKTATESCWRDLKGRILKRIWSHRHYVNHRLESGTQSEIHAVRFIVNSAQSVKELLCCMEAEGSLLYSDMPPPAVPSWATRIHLNLSHFFQNSFATKKLSPLKSTCIFINVLSQLKGKNGQTNSYFKNNGKEEKTQSFLIFDQQHRSMKCSIISNHICQCNLFSTILQQS